MLSECKNLLSTLLNLFCIALIAIFACVMDSGIVLGCRYESSAQVVTILYLQI